MLNTISTYRSRPKGITILVILEVIGTLNLPVAGIAVAAFSGFIEMYINPFLNQIVLH